MRERIHNGECVEEVSGVSSARSLARHRSKHLLTSLPAFPVRRARVSVAMQYNIPSSSLPARLLPETTAAKRVPASYGGARKPSRAGFLPKLYAVVNNPRYQDIIHWDQSGTIIVVQDAHRLSTEVCPVIYDQKDSTSFFRQMNVSLALASPHPSFISPLLIWLSTWLFI